VISHLKMFEIRDGSRGANSLVRENGLARTDGV
jgi:hypothetical protein